MIRKRMILPEHIVKCGCNEGIGGDGMALAVVREGGEGFEGDVGRLGGYGRRTVILRSGQRKGRA